MEQILVCHISQSAGGVETYIANLLRNSDRSRFRHAVICYTNGTLASQARDLGSEVIMAPMSREINPVKDLISLLRILRIVHRMRPDIIHAHSGKGGIWGRLCGTMLGIPVVFTPNAFSYVGQLGRLRTFVLTVEKLLAYAPCLLVASSESEAKRAIEEVGWKRRRVTADFPNSIEVKDQVIHHNSKEELRVLMIGRLCYQKNPEMFLRVAKLVCNQISSIKFTILGAGYADELSGEVSRMMRQLDLEGAVSIVSWGNSEAVELELLRSDIYVSTSRYESFGYTTAEAMEKGLPVVATDIDGSVDLVEHGSTGYLVSIDNDEQMASYLCQLAADTLLRERLGELGRRRIHEIFNIRKNITAIESIYLSLCERPRHNTQGISLKQKPRSL